MVFRMLHIVTVGTSVVRNAFRDSDRYPVLASYRGLFGRWSVASPDSFEDVEASKVVVPSHGVFRALLGYIDSDPRRSSAELNALLGYFEILDDDGVEAVHDVLLFSTDSGVCWLCTRVLEEYLRDLGKGRLRDLGIVLQRIESVVSERIPLFGRDFKKGSINLLVRVRKIVARAREKYDIILANLTAGFKPESSLLLLASTLYGIDKAYYIHETMREVVEIPLIPLKLSDEIKVLLEKLAKGLELSVRERDILARIGILPPSRKVADWSRELARILLGVG
ncbi:MAG: hypothetical protein DRO40_06810 [Thermoprotei archaeon]|nr:MAG: hypothetical protein DRO40_06810 [Thermoprotei archaeon]